MKAILKEILSTSIYLLCVLLVTFLIVNFVGQRTQVVGSSMESTLSDGDNLIVDKITYRFKDPERYDIIVLIAEGNNVWGQQYVKRIIGLPGETVQIDDEGNIFIDGEQLDESYGKEVMLEAGRASEPITLQDDEYFVLGDNRNDSSDSRMEAVGNIKRDDIIGRAWVRIYPFDSIGVLKHQ